ncbi:MAG: tellurite resistance/C4-dicarboxylate transporter family protein [Microbacteriaceae bacterium]
MVESAVAGSGVVARLRSGVRQLSPAYFAIVMATGIISAGLLLEGSALLSDILLAVSVLAYLVLIVLNVWRVIADRSVVVADLRDPAQAFGFFTFVAATNVLGARLAMDWGIVLPAVLLAVSGAAWLISGYAIPWAVMLSERQRSVLSGVDGTWFIWAVASQSVAVLAASLETELVGIRELLSVVAIASWGVGLILYATIGILVIVRLVTHGITPEELGPAYWVAMGAAAITVLAGSRIVEMSNTPMVTATRGLVAGGAVVLWCFATWLIPVLVAIGWWRHVAHRIPLLYTPALWGIIFPLGMYAVAGIYLGQADRLPLVTWIGSVFLWVAIAAWLATAAGMAVALARRFFSRARTS